MFFYMLRLMALDVEDKSTRVENYHGAMIKNLREHSTPQACGGDARHSSPGLDDFSDRVARWSVLSIIRCNLPAAPLTA
jgi:hypothetical protein